MVIKIDLIALVRSDSAYLFISCQKEEVTDTAFASLWYANRYHGAVNATLLVLLHTCISLKQGYLASMTACWAKCTQSAFYLSPHYCNLRQLDNIRPYCVEHILELVYDGYKSLHARECWINLINPYFFRDGAKVIQCPSDTTIATTPTRRLRDFVGCWEL